MYSSIPQILVLFRVLSRQSLRAQKRKKKIEKEVLQVLPGHVVVFVLVFVLSECALRNTKSTCENTAHPHVFVFVICQSWNLSIISTLFFLLSVELNACLANDAKRNI